jgi:DNA polymerase III epsilon subunit family exonuclease
VPRNYVALDLETTGLNPTRDAIIEVGAVRFLDGLPVETYTTLVNPDRPIPYEITMLTGIADRDVLGKPRFEQVAPHLSRFVGSMQVVGHNVSFDLGFLRAQRLFHENIGLDSWELATILLPNMPSYSLSSLAERLGIPMEGRHRAEHDAQATGLLFAKGFNRLSHGTFNPLIGAAGISAFPMAARVVQKVAQEEDFENFPLMHAMGANAAGQVASTVAGGVILALFATG